ncbi:helix-turn-helix domain-containing protein [Corynebacterium freneyi]|uniref:Helix-turn-helix domain-containing protein n=1 Tax=Corynebacterium freneyi DNF00450 TaxID=1287475 RepID=A0A095XYQ5_9CORY|nr:helix-turn-helix domain-containing protein [Corynebacterium freneyi]KGF15163.1 hypothetical protein HMPREF1650_11835 [Corynebacterium freneyi DNF00450]
MDFFNRVVVLSPYEARTLAKTVLRYDRTVPGGLRPHVRKLADTVLAGLPSLPAEPEMASPLRTHHEVRGADVVTTGEAARILDVTPRRVTQLAKEEKLPGNKPNGRWFFLRDDIEAYRDFRN